MPRNSIQQPQGVKQEEKKWCLLLTTRRWRRSWPAIDCNVAVYLVQWDTLCVDDGDFIKDILIMFIFTFPAIMSRVTRAAK